MLFVYPFQASHVGQLVRRWYRKLPALTQLLHLILGSLSGFGRELLKQDSAVGKRRGVQVHELGDALEDLVRRARDHEPAVAMPEEHDVVEILELYEVHHVGYVSFQVDLGRGEVHPLTKTSEGDRIGIVSLLSEATGDSLPTPAPQPSATY